MYYSAGTFVLSLSSSRLDALFFFCFVCVFYPRAHSLSAPRGHNSLSLKLINTVLLRWMSRVHVHVSSEQRAWSEPK